MWFIFICRGVPSGPHIPHEELGGQGEALDQRQRLKDKYCPFCQKQGNYILLKGVIWSHNLNFMAKSFMKGTIGKRMKNIKEGMRWKLVDHSFISLTTHFSLTFTILPLFYLLHISSLSLTFPPTISAKPPSKHQKYLLDNP